MALAAYVRSLSYLCFAPRCCLSRVLESVSSNHAVDLFDKVLMSRELGDRCRHRRRAGTDARPESVARTLRRNARRLLRDIESCI